MPNSAKVKFNEIDLSSFIDSLIGGIAAVSLQTLRGPYGHDGSVIATWPEFVKKYGGEVEGLEGASLVKRAFSYGCALRVNKVGNYTDPADAGTLTAEKAAFDAALGSNAVDTEDYFEVVPKYAGADYNNLVVQILEASNGDADAFDLVVSHLNEPSLGEIYQNLKIEGTPTIAESDYLNRVKSGSALIDINYLDCSGLSGQLRPDDGTYSATTGSNGDPVTAADYEGDEAGGTGVYAFDQYSDFEVIASLDNSDTSVLQAYSAYTDSRQDSVTFAHLKNTSNTVTKLITERGDTNIDSRFTAFFAGGLEIPDPFLENTQKEISELGDVLGLAMFSSREFGPWWSFAGTQRGVIRNASDVVNNFYGANTIKLDQLAQRQINVVVNQNGRIYIKGNFSAQMASSRKSFLNVVKLIIFIKKSLRPNMELYLEEPNDFRTFLQIYNEVEPFLSSLVGGEKRALVDYEWRGDQFATKDSELVINNRADLDQGKYRVQLWLKEVVSLQEFTIDIISAPSGVSFE
jgi:hypothetical protein